MNTAFQTLFQQAAISSGAMQNVHLSQQELVLAQHYRVSE